MNLGLSLAPHILDEHLRKGEAEDNQAAPTDLVEHNDGGCDKVEGSIKVGWALPDKGPNAIGLAHYDMVDVARAEVLVSGAGHLEIFAEEHNLEGCVGTVAHLNHLEAEVLPGRMDADTDEWDKKAECNHSNRLLDWLVLPSLQPAEHLVDDVG